MIRAVRVLALACALVLPSLPAAAQGTGLVFLEPDRYRSIPLAPPTGLTSIPAEMDLSKDFPTPGDQGSQGSCVGWAVGYALKSYQERRERLWTNWDDTKRMSPAFVYNQIKVGGCDDGARIADALDLVTSTGAAAWIDQPYSENSCNSLATELAKQNAAVNRVAAWFRVNPQDRQAIKTSIAAGIPVVVGMRVDDKFKALNAGETWRGGGVPAEAHAMVVVGYSDSRDAVKVINSWGTDWGDGGFGWIDFETFRAVTREAYVAQDIVLPVGMAERKEHPYTVKSGPHGPAIFGAKLGMTRDQVNRMLTRKSSISTVTQENRTFTHFTVDLMKSGYPVERVVYKLDDEFDFVSSIQIFLSTTDWSGGYGVKKEYTSPQVLEQLEITLSKIVSEKAVEYKNNRDYVTFDELSMADMNRDVIARLPKLPAEAALLAMHNAVPKFLDVLTSLDMKDLGGSYADQLIGPNQYGKYGGSSSQCCEAIAYESTLSRPVDLYVQKIRTELGYFITREYPKAAVNSFKRGDLDRLVSSPYVIMSVTLEASTTDKVGYFQ